MTVLPIVYHSKHGFPFSPSVIADFSIFFWLARLQSQHHSFQIFVTTAQHFWYNFWVTHLSLQLCCVTAIKPQGRAATNIYFCLWACDSPVMLLWAGLSMAHACWGRLRVSSMTLPVLAGLAHIPGSSPEVTSWLTALSLVSPHGLVLMVRQSGKREQKRTGFLVNGVQLLDRLEEEHWVLRLSI